MRGRRRRRGSAGSRRREPDDAVSERAPVAGPGVVRHVRRPPGRGAGSGAHRPATGFVRCVGSAGDASDAGNRLPALRHAERGRGAVLRRLRLRLHDRPGPADDGANRRRRGLGAAARSRRSRVGRRRRGRPSVVRAEGPAGRPPVPAGVVVDDRLDGVDGRSSGGRARASSCIPRSLSTATPACPGATPSSCVLRTGRGPSSTSARRTARTSCRPARPRATTSRRFRSVSLVRSPTGTRSTSEPGRSSRCAAPAADGSRVTAGAFASSSEGVCCGDAPVEVASFCLRSLGIAAEGLDSDDPGGAHGALLECEPPSVPGFVAEPLRRAEEP